MDDQVLKESGLLLVDKPAEWTSHDVVKFVRCFGFKKVGHCGTLDPQATGLLVLLLGRATKLTNRFSGQDKTYKGIIRLGIETDSQDADGTVTAEHDWSHVTEQMLRDKVAEYQGDLMQIPPMVSAKKQGGKRLYKLARQGIEVEREPRPITVHRFELTAINLPEAEFVVECSKGTYVRTLSADIGQDLRCGAHLKRLRRTASGPFEVDDACTMEQLKSWTKDDVIQHFIGLEQVLTYF